MELVPSYHVICPRGLLSKTGGEEEEEKEAEKGESALLSRVTVDEWYMVDK